MGNLVCNIYLSVTARERVGADPSVSRALCASGTPNNGPENEDVGLEFHAGTEVFLESIALHVSHTQFCTSPVNNPN